MVAMMHSLTYQITPWEITPQTTFRDLPHAPRGGTILLCCGHKHCRVLWIFTRRDGRPLHLRDLRETRTTAKAQGWAKRRGTWLCPAHTHSRKKHRERIAR